jgi:cell division protein FtsL
MNTAARLFNQGVISRSWVVSVLLSRTHCMVMTLALAVLTSALGVIYVANASRSLNAAIQHGAFKSEQMHIQWGQLLLEKSTWVMQARVQRIAEHELNMALPNNKSVVIVNE